MKRIILTQNGKDILGSDGLMYIDGRLSLSSIKYQIIARNARYVKNFPHKIADGFYMTSGQLQKSSKIFSL